MLFQSSTFGIRFLNHRSNLGGRGEGEREGGEAGKGGGEGGGITVVHSMVDGPPDQRHLNRIPVTRNTHLEKVEGADWRGGEGGGSLWCTAQKISLTVLCEAL